MTLSFCLLVASMASSHAFIPAQLSSMAGSKKVTTSKKSGSHKKKSSHASKIGFLLDKEATRLDPTMKDEIKDIVDTLADQYKVDPMLILAVMKIESSFNPKAISNKGAMGFMQVMPIVVKDVASELGIHPDDHSKLLTSHQFNLKVGVHYLANLLKRFHGDKAKALMAYNAGPTMVAKVYGGRSVPEGGYQGKVLNAYRQFTAQTARL